MLRPFVLIALCLTTTAAAQPPADAPKEAPKPPDGWKVMAAPDLSFQTFVPAKTTRTGTRTRTFRSGRLSFRVQLAYATLPDGLTLTAEAINLAGAGVRSTKPDDLFKLIADGEREDGYTVSEPAPVKAGGLDGVTFTASKGTDLRKVVLVGGRPRVYALTASAGNPTLLTGKTADAFFDSLALTPEKAAAAVAKQKAEAAKGAEAAAKAEADGTAPPWTIDPTKMVFPDKPAYGRLLGKPFAVQSADLFADAQLTLYAGAGSKVKDDHFWIVLSALNKGKLAGQAFEVAPTRVGGPSVHMTLAAAGGQKRRAEVAPRVALKAEFGQPADGKMPCKIYLCCDDKDRSVVAGTFEVPVK